MPETKDTDRSLSDIQLDDFSVDRQRERLEQSRPGNLQSGDQQTQQKAPQAPQAPDAGARQGERR